MGQQTRQHKAIVVIRMITDQISPAMGGCRHLRQGGKMMFKERVTHQRLPYRSEYQQHVLAVNPPRKTL